jgi:hypothetical protein
MDATLLAVGTTVVASLACWFRGIGKGLQWSPSCWTDGWLYDFVAVDVIEI